MFGLSNRLNAIACKFIKFLLWFFILSTFFIIHAQSNDSTFEKIVIEIDGETVFDIYEITQDHQGYMWLATNLGLIRYNGLEGKKYDIKRSDSSSIANERIRSLYVDSLGDIWIGANSGLSKYKPECDCLYQYPSKTDEINLREILSFTEDKNNNLYLGTWHDGLLRYERESDSFTRMLHKPNDSISLVNKGIYHLLVDQVNNLWIGTDSGLFRFDINTGKIKQFYISAQTPIAF